MRIDFENVNGCNEVYTDCLRALCGNTEGKSLLDAMSNLAPHTPLLGYKERAYVDILPRILDHKEEQQYFIQQDIFDFISTTEKTFDCIIISDGIEHVTMDKGQHLLKLFSEKTNRIITFTPLGNYMVDDTDNPEGHHSGWLPISFSNEWAHIVFKNYHPTLGIGAFFSWTCENIEQDFERVSNELKNKSWAK